MKKGLILEAASLIYDKNNKRHPQPEPEKQDIPAAKETEPAQNSVEETNRPIRKRRICCGKKSPVSGLLNYSFSKMLFGCWQIGQT